MTIIPNKELTKTLKCTHHERLSRSSSVESSESLPQKLSFLLRQLSLESPSLSILCPTVFS